MWGFCCNSHPLRGLKRETYRSPSKTSCCNSHPLRGLKPLPLSFFVCSYRCNSHPLRGLKLAAPRGLRIAAEVATHTPCGDWNSAHRIKLYQMLYVATHTPCGDWNCCPQVQGLRGYGCNSHPLRGLKRHHSLYFVENVWLQLTPLAGIETHFSMSASPLTRVATHTPCGDWNGDWWSWRTYS